MEFVRWLKREHPSGKVDWRKEFERLWDALEQAIPLESKNKPALCQILLE
jgi:hypothetical protein